VIPTTIAGLARAYRSGQLSPVEVVDDRLRAIAAVDDDLRAFITVSADAARAAAGRAERQLRDGPPASPLLGVPVAHKDILHTEDAPTTGGSRRYEGRGPTSDATAVARLRAAGMISLGKTNLSEFACGSMDLRGMPRNPAKAGYYTGGSSGGSGAAVAGGLVPAATGTDTAGSIRVPASFCGLVGVKPSRGRVSNHGLEPLSWTMDTVGPMTTTVEDAALMLAAMAGHDPRDPRSAAVPVDDYPSAAAAGVAGLRVGVPTDHFYAGLAPAVDEATRRALATLEELGARLVPVALPLAGELAAAGSILVMSEAFAVHAESLAAAPEAYGSRTRQRIAAGGAYRLADLHGARRLADAWSRQLAAVMATVDVLVTPTLPFTAFTLERQRLDPPDTSWGTRHFNMSGLPALTLPSGVDGDGLPIGLQIAAKAFDERTMFRAAFAVEAARSGGSAAATEATA